MRRRGSWAVLGLAAASWGFALVAACGSDQPASEADAGAGAADAASFDASSTDGTATTDGGSIDAHDDRSVEAGGADASGDGSVEAGVAFMYAAQSGSTNVVYGYAWSAATGRLTPIDMDPATPGVQGAPTATYPIAVVAHPNGKWVYTVTYSSPPEVSAYSVNPTTGVLTEINADARLDAGVHRLSLSLAYVAGLAAMDPAGRCVYVTDQNGNLVALTVDASGALTVARAVPGAHATWLAVDPQARFIVTAVTGQVAIHKLDAVSGLPIGPDGGAGPGVTYTTQVSSGTIVLDPTGTFAYVPDYLDGQVLTFRVDPNAPSLTPMATATTSNAPYAAVADPNGPYLYTAGTNGTGTGVLTIGDGGVLSEVPSDAGEYSVQGFPLSLDPPAKHLYMGWYPYGTIKLVDVGPNGSLVGAGTADDDGGLAPYNPARTFAWVRP